MKKKNLLFTGVLMGTIILLTACDAIVDGKKIPFLSTTEVTERTQTTAISGGNITDDGGATVTARGVCWSTSQTPTINDSKTEDGNGAGSFKSSITGLEPNTTYYVRAYANNSEGTGYGNAIVFTTLVEINYGNGVTDIDGNEYVTVIIGNQEWMAENLRVTKYRNGDAIPRVQNPLDWILLASGAYCWYDNNYNTYGKIYGTLYNYYAVSNSRGLCPEGWHVPSDAEWTQLVDYVVAQGYPNDDWDDPNGAGNALKSRRQVGSPFGGEYDTGTHPRWDSDDTHYGFNEFGFSALPGGFRLRAPSPDFHNVGEGGYWWSATSIGSSAYRYSISHGGGKMDRGVRTKTGGESIRCVRD